MNEFKKLLNSALGYLGFLNDDQKLSLTNVAVIVFISITAFRALFGGALLTLSEFKWTVQEIDLASTLPMLFALLNYGHKRIVGSKTQSEEKDTTTNV